MVEESGSSLFGRDLLAVLKLNWKSLAIHHTAKYPSLSEVLAKNEAVFSNKLGATPRFYNACSVPYTLSEKIEHELDRLQGDKITFSDWAAPIVPVSKPDGSICIIS